MNNFKINVYDDKGNYKSTIIEIMNNDFFSYSEIVNGGQGNFNIELDTNFDNFSYSELDFIELVFYNDEYKTGQHKFTGIISGINRVLSIEEGEKITLEINGIVELLSKYNINKNYSGALKDVIDEFITDFHNQKDLDTEMEYLGQHILKNGVSNTDNVDVDVDGTFFDALQKIFGDKEFFIDRTGTIKYIEEIDTENVFTLYQDIHSIEINNEGEINISISGYYKDVEVGNKILLQNINTNLNLENQRIKEIAQGLDVIEITLGKIKDYRNVIK